MHSPLLIHIIYTDINLMILDDQRPLVPKWAREIFSDERALKYVKGIGIHWYADALFPVPFALGTIQILLKHILLANIRFLSDPSH